jgi:hypothetical protein
MKKLILLMTIGSVAVLGAVAFLPSASAQAETCPEEGKVEANGGNQDAINNLVLPAGTTVCIKGGQTLVTVTADGVKTLQQLLGTGQDVSHYTIITPPGTTTTGTTTTGTTTTGTTTTGTTTTGTTTTGTTTTGTTTTGTTTTVPGGGGGTTTVPVTTTTSPTVGPTTVEPSTTTKSPIVAPTTVSPRGTAFTGVENAVPIGAIALMLMTSGTGLLWAGSRRKRDQNQDEE